MTAPLRPQALLPRARLAVAAPLAAQRLLGCIIEHETCDGLVAGRIVETEAYDQSDPASHSCRGVTPRTQPMFGPAGFLYVYRSYGIHLCMNITCGSVGHGAAVLIRALEPVQGLDVMTHYRAVQSAAKKPLTVQALRQRLCRGPGNLTQAMGIQLQQTGADALQSDAPLRLLTGHRVPAARRIASPRIGISQGQDTLWRFYEADNPYVSGPKGRAR
jgi:DNA-3-methyladenine glycosylase